MSSTSSRRVRNIIAKTNFFRVTPFTVTDTKVSEATQTSLVDVPTTSLVVASVPSSMSYAMAKALEDELSEKLQRPVLVISDNIKLCAMEGPLDPSEIKEAIKGLDGDASELVEKLFARAEGDDDAEGAEEGNSEEESGSVTKEESGEKSSLDTGEVDS